MGDCAFGGLRRDANTLLNENLILPCSVSHCFKLWHASNSKRRMTGLRDRRQVALCG